MLVLRRKISQKIIIGENIELTVVAITGGRVRLGLTAPKSVTIRRSELDTLHEETTNARPTDGQVHLIGNQSKSA